jgi:predicted nucleic acid-binding protein
MAFLVDTSLLVRLANVAEALHPIAKKAIAELHRRGELLHITPQNLVEFRGVATRPKAANGMGLIPADAEAHATAFEASFPSLPDTPGIYPAWKSLVTALGVIGKRVHDARLIAVCHSHQVSHLLTFNVAHFASMAAFGPGIVVVDVGTF